MVTRPNEGLYKVAINYSINNVIPESRPQPGVVIQLQHSWYTMMVQEEGLMVQLVHHHHLLSVTWHHRLLSHTPLTTIMETLHFISPFMTKVDTVLSHPHIITKEFAQFGAKAAYFITSMRVHRGGHV